jgi:hypothetical protein
MPQFNVYKTLGLCVSIEAETDEAAIRRMLDLDDRFFQIRECDHYAVRVGPSEDGEEHDTEPCETDEATVLELQADDQRATASKLAAATAAAVAETTQTMRLLCELAAEAEKVLSEVGQAGHLPPSWRWPLIDELNGAVAMARAKLEAPQVAEERRAG